MWEQIRMLFRGQVERASWRDTQLDVNYSPANGQRAASSEVSHKLAEFCLINGSQWPW